MARSILRMMMILHGALMLFTVEDCACTLCTRPTTSISHGIFPAGPALLSEKPLEGIGEFALRDAEYSAIQRWSHVRGARRELEEAYLVLHCEPPRIDDGDVVVTCSPCVPFKDKDILIDVIGMSCHVILAVSTRNESGGMP